jgi:hypothetical protein
MIEITNHDLIQLGFIALSMSLGYWLGWRKARYRQAGDKVAVKHHGEWAVATVEVIPNGELEFSDVKEVAMTEIEALRNRIEEWQANPNRHSLTCLVDSNHAPLKPVIYARNRLHLECPTCGYVQDYIPCVFTNTIKAK